MLDPFGALPDWMMIVGFMTFPLAVAIAFLIMYIDGKKNKPEYMSWSEWFNKTEPMPEHVVIRRKRRQKPFWAVCAIVIVLGTISMGEQEGWARVGLVYLILGPGWFMAILIIGLIQKYIQTRPPKLPARQGSNNDDFFVPEDPNINQPESEDEWFT